MTDIGLYRRRGSAYISLLGVSMIVTVIGLSALLGTRVELRTAGLTEAATQARYSAASGLELVLLRIATDPKWRTTYSNDTWTAEETILDVAFSFKLVDEQDGDLANDLTQPVRLFAKAIVGDAVRIYSVLLEAEGAEGEIIERRVAAEDDDAEERFSDGNMFWQSVDLDLAVGSTTDIVGMRFTNITIPQDAAIQIAWVQFKAEETGSGAIALTILGEDVDDAAQFIDSSYNITSRSTTGESVAWSPPAWNSTGEAGVDQRTPDISAIIQEIVDRPGWSSGNALVIIITGTGTRTAESYDGNAGAAPLLHVEWDVGGGGSISHVPGSWRREVYAP